jgi:putative intracellular protease/amidase
MKLLVFITPNEFRDESIAKFKLFLDRWGIENKVTSYSKKECVGNHGAVYTPDINTGRVTADDYDGIVLVDGRGVETYKIYDYRPLLELLFAFNNKKKPIIAVGNAVKIPARANIIKDKKVAVGNGDEETKRLVLLFHGIPSEEGVEIADNLMTVGSYIQIDSAMPQILQHMGVM